MSQKQKLIFLIICCCSTLFITSATAATKVSFPYTPIGVASWPWWIAKDAGYFEKHGLDVDMVYVGASPVIVQAMLGGQAGVGAGGGTPLVTTCCKAAMSSRSPPWSPTRFSH